MLDLSPEISALSELPDDAKATFVARERREVFSVHPEIRALAWGGAMLVTAAAAILIRNNLERLGPTLIAILIAVAAAACYAWAAWRRKRASVVDDYVLLLAALLLSADLGFLEQQFDVFGAEGQRHFLVLAVAHALVAYLFDSRLVLTLSVSALAAWIGVEQRGVIDAAFGRPDDAVHLLVAGVATLTWREADRRFRKKRTFERLFEHFTANFALLASLILTADNDTEWLGIAMMIVFAALTIAWGFRVRAEAFVLYAFVYLVFALGIVLDGFMDDVEAILACALIAIVGLPVLHARFQRRVS